MKMVKDKQILMGADFAGYPLKEAIKEYLEKITDAFSHKYMAGELSADLTKGKLYNPQRVEPLMQVQTL